MSLFSALLSALYRFVLVMLIVVPVMLGLLVAAGVGGGSQGGGVTLVLIVGLLGLGWALEALLQAGRPGQVLAGLCWLSVAAWHATEAPASKRGTVLMIWLLVSALVGLFIAARHAPRQHPDP